MNEGNHIRMDKPGPNTPVPEGTMGVIRNFDASRGWEIQWETGVSTFFPGNGDEVSSMAAPGNMQCDFCTSKEPRWEHRAADSQNVLVAIRESGRTQSMGQGSLGSWAACDQCHRLIEAGDRQRLAMRAAKDIKRKHAHEGMSLRVVLPAIQSAHKMYWDNRVGPGFPIYEPTGGGR